MEEEHASRRVSFAVFEMDLRSGELRKHGLRIRLQRQPFEGYLPFLSRGPETW